jgi:hypothetical protein
MLEFFIRFIKIKKIYIKENNIIVFVFNLLIIFLSLKFLSKNDEKKNQLYNIIIHYIMVSLYDFFNMIIFDQSLSSELNPFILGEN